MNWLVLTCFGLFYTATAWMYASIKAWPLNLFLSLLFVVITLMTYGPVFIRAWHKRRPEQEGAISKMAAKLPPPIPPAKRWIPLVTEWLMGSFWVYVAVFAAVSGLWWVALMALLQLKEAIGLFAVTIDRLAQKDKA